MENELNYLKLIEIPVCTTEIKPKEQKKRKKKKIEDLKNSLIKKINGETENAELSEVAETDTENVTEERAEFYNEVRIEKKKQKISSERTTGVIMAQVGIICVLVLAIFLTNIFWADSGINTLIKSVFATEHKTEQIDERSYTAFAPSIPTKTQTVEIRDGAMCFSGGSIYALCDGKITAINQVDGLYNITVQYSDSFKSIMSGVDYAYYSEGDAVYKSLPVCYSRGGEVKVFLYDNNNLLTNYVLDNGVIVWQS